MVRKDSVKTIMLSTTQLKLIKSALRFCLIEKIYMNKQQELQVKVLLKSLKHDTQCLTYDTISETERKVK